MPISLVWTTDHTTYTSNESTEVKVKKSSEIGPAGTGRIPTETGSLPTGPDRTVDKN